MAKQFKYEKTKFFLEITIVKQFSCEALNRKLAQMDKTRKLCSFTI